MLERMTVAPVRTGRDKAEKQQRANLDQMLTAQSGNKILSKYTLWSWTIII